MKRIDKYKNEMKGKRAEEEKERGKILQKTGLIEPKTHLWLLITYAVIIFSMAEAIIWFFGLKAVQDNLIAAAKHLELDIMLDKALDYIYTDLSDQIDYESSKNAFVSLKDWLWLFPFGFFSLLIGIIHPSLIRASNIFRMVMSTCILVFLLKLFAFSIPYGVLPAFRYFPDFIQKVYINLGLIFVINFIFLYIGVEIATFWRKNFGSDNKSFWEE